MARIIGIAGLAGAGKDTAAQAMQRMLVADGKEVRIGSFADPIREISRYIGLHPYDRGLKEVRRTFDQSDFNAALQAGIDVVLGERLPEKERADLYSYTVEALEKFCYRQCCGLGERVDCYSPPECCCNPDEYIGLSPREFMQVLGTEGGQNVRKTLWVELARSLWDCLPGYVLVPDCRFAHELDVLDRLVLVIRPGTMPVNQHASERLAYDLTQGIIPDRFRYTMSRLYNTKTQTGFERDAAYLSRVLCM